MVMEPAGVNVSNISWVFKLEFTRVNVFIDADFNSGICESRSYVAS